jgi:hypothetical protein
MSDVVVMEPAPAPAAVDDPMAVASAYIARVRAKIDDLDGRSRENLKQQALLRVPALIDGDVKARKSLDDLRRENLRLAADHEALQVEFAAAEQRHREAIAEASRAADGEVAREVAEEFDAIVALTERSDRIAEALIEHLDVIAERLDNIARRGCPYPNSGQVRTVLHRRLSTIVQRIKWTRNFELRFLAPGDRVQSLHDIAVRWRDGPVRGWVEERGGQTMVEPAKAAVEAAPVTVAAE